MPYDEQTWTPLPSRTTPLSAARLTHIESGLEAAHDVLDALDDNYAPRSLWTPSTTRWYPIQDVQDSAVPNFTPVLNRISYAPWLPSRQGVLEGIAVRVNAAAAGTGATLRLGVFENDANGEPGELITDRGLNGADSDTGTPSTGNGIRSWEGLNLETPRDNIYWFGLLPQTAIGILTVTGVYGPNQFVGHVAPSGNAAVYRDVNTYAAPAAMPPEGEVGTTVVTVGPQYYVKWAS